MISDGLRTLCAWLCQAIYILIAGLYDLFINISRVELLTSDHIQPIYQRITMILTIVMVFYVTFEAVKYVIQPEQFSDKEKGAQKIVLKMVAVVVLIAFVPKIFSGAYWVQNKIFDTQVFSKVILGKQDVSTDQFGKNLSYNIFNMFYSLDEESFTKKELEEENNCEDMTCKQLVALNLYTLQSEGRMPYLTTGINSKDKVTENTTGNKVEKYYISFNGLFAVGVGAFIAYMLLLYCVDAGVRVIQLLFLQIIAPIPIMGYLSPKKDGMFEKWTKQCLTTYLDLFLRVGIIYFVLLVCEILGDSFMNGSLLGNNATINGDMKWFIYIALVMGLLLFAHKAPKMLEELFPKTGSAAAGKFGLSMKDRPGVASAVGMTVGASLVGTRKLIGAGVNRFKRNRQNKDQREEKANDYKTKDSAYRDALKKRTRIRDQRKNGTLMIEEKDADGKVTRRRAATAEEAQKMQKQAEKELKDKKIDRDSAKAAYNNTKYRSTALSALAGGVTGVVQGAVAGSKATDEKSITKQVKEGFKNADASLAKTEKWYDEGGGSYVDRTITAVEHAFGITTSSAQITRDIKQIDENIKGNEVLITAESDTKSKRDDVEKRLESKLESGELKTELGANEEAYLRSKVSNNLDIRTGDTVSSIYARYKAKKEAAKSSLDTIIKTRPADETNQESMDKYNKSVEQARRALEIATDEETKMKKHAMRAAYTYMLKNPNDGAHNDAVAVGKLKTMQESIINANRNQATVNDFIERTNLAKKQALANATAKKGSPLTTDEESAINAIYNRQIDAFTGAVSFKDYDELDEIVVRLQNMADDRMRDNMAYKETKRRIEASDATAAAKADNSASGGK